MHMSWHKLQTLKEALLFSDNCTAVARSWQLLSPPLLFLSFAVAHILTNPIKAAATVKAQYAAMQMTYFVTLC